jgi:hypothetical protein
MDHTAGRDIPKMAAEDRQYKLLFRRESKRGGRERLGTRLACGQSYNPIRSSYREVSTGIGTTTRRE